MKSRAPHLLLSALTVLSLGCVESAPSPKLIPQAEIRWGDKLYLIDRTRDVQLRANSDCVHFARVTIVGAMTSSTASVSFTLLDTTDPNEFFENTRAAINCYVKTTPDTLKVDVLETTNALYQFCIDSGPCRLPNPADASANQLCSNADRFDDCPVVEVPQGQAVNFCASIGRRLPTTFEQIAIRQASSMSTTDLEKLNTLFPTGKTPPATCAEAVIKAGACNQSKPGPMEVTDNPVGAAPRDVVTGVNGDEIYDLMGNVAEWSADMFAQNRGNAAMLPWFCAAALPDLGDGIPTCPPGAHCVYGSYRPEGQVYKEWPVCVTSGGSFGGTIGTVAGGSYKDEGKSDNVGVFSRRVEGSPQELPDTARAREYGIRCVDDRDSAVEGVVKPFMHQLQVVKD